MSQPILLPGRGKCLEIVGDRDAHYRNGVESVRSEENGDTLQVPSTGTSQAGGMGWCEVVSGG